jgi:hypothetical protein
MSRQVPFITRLESAALADQRDMDRMDKMTPTQRFLAQNALAVADLADVIGTDDYATKNIVRMWLAYCGVSVHRA